MADRKLFNLAEATPTNTKKIAFGDSGSTANNITLGNFKTWLGIMTGGTKTLITPIGAWNMNTTQYVALIPLSFPMQPGQIFPTYPATNKIRGVKVLIMNDSGKGMSDFLSVQNGTAATVPQIQIAEFTFIFTSLNATLTRRNGSFYATDPVYSNAGVNRGWIVLEYID